MRSGRLRILFLLGYFVAFGGLTPLIAKERRVALVIGNAAYQHTPELKNPKNDAIDVAAQLKRLGFEVIDAFDTDKRAMERAIRTFAQNLNGADVGVFYYAGHGIQVNGQNYLVPIDAKLDDASGLDFEMVRLDLVHRTMEREAKTNVIFIDACRDNPLARNLARAMGTRSGNIGRGLAAVEAGVGTLISFSTQPGNVAVDGVGRNSPYAASLAAQLASSSRDLSSVLIDVRNDVRSATHGRQVPWEHSSLTAHFYFTDPASESQTKAAIPKSQVPQAPAATNYDKEMEIAFWNAVKDSKSPAILKTYVDRFPNGTFANLARVMIENLQPPRGTATAEPTPPTAPPVPSAPAAVSPPASGTQVAALPPPTPSAPPPDPEALARAIQAELKRVGCDPGSVDGKWGGKVKSALGTFASRQKIALATDQPTPQALQAIANQKGRVCPIECDDDETEVDGKCVPKKSQSKSSRPSSSSTGSRQRQGSSSSGSSGSSSGKICWDSYQRSAIVSCDHPRAIGK